VVLLRSQNHFDSVATHQVLKAVHPVCEGDSLELVRSVGDQLHLVAVLVGRLDTDNSITVGLLSAGILGVLKHVVATEQVTVGVGRLGR